MRDLNVVDRVILDQSQSYLYEGGVIEDDIPEIKNPKKKNKKSKSDAKLLATAENKLRDSIIKLVANAKDLECEGIEEEIKHLDLLELIYLMKGIKELIASQDAVNIIEKQVAIGKGKSIVQMAFDFLGNN